MGINGLDGTPVEGEKYGGCVRTHIQQKEYQEVYR